MRRPFCRLIGTEHYFRTSSREEGQELDVVVESVEPAQKRIRLRLAGGAGADGAPADKADGAPRAHAAREGDHIEVEVDRVEQQVLAVKWDGGRGTVPASETGTTKGTDLRKAFPPGTKFRAKVIEMEKDGRVKLSKRAADRDEERRSVRDYMRAEQKKMKGFGTIGDLIKLKKQ